MIAQPSPLADGFGRRLEYLRISVTDRCDLRCSYCMPRGYRGFVGRAEWLDVDEIARIAHVMAALGVRRVRLTGGEPLLRRDLVDLAGRISRIAGVDDLSLSTNGTQLADHAAALRAAGVSRLNVSLDTLRPERFVAITGFDGLDRVLDGLEAARAAGFAPIKINMVPIEGVNAGEVEDLAAWCIERGFVLRLIEMMPIGAAAPGLRPAAVTALRDRLRQRFALVDATFPGGGPARYLQSRDRSFTVGFITPLSQHFCAACNRVRLTVDGVLHLCLGKEDRIDLRSALRSGASDADVGSLIRAGVQRKPWQHDFREDGPRTIRVMAATGG